MPKPHRPTAALLAVATTWAAVASIAAVVPVRAELPPDVYADQQRRAETVVRLRVLSTLRNADQLSVQARVLAIQRQSPVRPVRIGQAITVRYALPIWRRQGWVGPSPVPVLRSGEQVTAWLNRGTAPDDSFRPAAGGLSFGPSQETMPLTTP